MYSHTFLLNNFQKLFAVSNAIIITHCMLVLIKITCCRDGQLIWLAGHFEMTAFSG